MKNKFGCYENFHIINADFEKYAFEENAYDLVYSAATIQWIPEEIAFFKYKEWKSERVLNAEEYIFYISTNSEHITLEEPYKSNFYDGIRKVIMDAGDRITIMDTVPLYLFQKPW